MSSTVLEAVKQNQPHKIPLLFSIICQSNKLTLEMLQNAHRILNCSFNTIIPFSTDRTALHYICINPKVTVEMLKYAKKHHANFTAKTDIHNTPMHFLCSNPNISKPILKFCNKLKLSYNTLNMHDQTPLHNLCQNNNTNVALIKYSLKHNGSLDSTDAMNMFLMICVHKPLQFDLILLIHDNSTIIQTHIDELEIFMTDEIKAILSNSIIVNESNEYKIY